MRPTVRDFDELPAMLTARDLQAALGLSRVKVYELLNAADFPTVRFGRAIRVPKDGLLRWLEARTMA